MINRDTKIDVPSAFNIILQFLQSENAKIEHANAPSYIRAQHGSWYALTPRDGPVNLSINVVGTTENTRVSITSSLTGLFMAYIVITYFFGGILLGLGLGPGDAISPISKQMFFFGAILTFIVTTIWIIWFEAKKESFARDIVRVIP